MKLVGDFLSRFYSLTPPHDAVKRAVAESLRDVVGVLVQKEKISIDNGIAHIPVSSVAKNVIKINRGVLLNRVFERLPKARESLRDIR